MKNQHTGKMHFIYIIIFCAFLHFVFESIFDKQSEDSTDQANMLSGKQTPSLDHFTDGENTCFVFTYIFSEFTLKFNINLLDTKYIFQVGPTLI